jgi:LmbE family N-acetylglucosaminyl deacetylase
MFDTSTSTTAPATGATTPVRDLADRLSAAAPTLLAVWAHPDDESYLGAGLMAAVAARGGRVVNVCATLGEHGTPDPTAFPPSQLASVRRRELTAALAGIGVEESVVLGYGDGDCAATPDGMGARRVGTVIDEVRPDIVLSFGPDGVTGHPDHRAVGRWAARAVAQRGDDIALVTTAATAAWPGDIVEAMHRVEAFYPGYPEHLGHQPVWPVHLDAGLLEAKMTALHAHESQIGPLHAELGPSDYRRLATTEAYRPANDAAVRRLVEGEATARSAA